MKILNLELDEGTARTVYGALDAARYWKQGEQGRMIEGALADIDEARAEVLAALLAGALLQEHPAVITMLEDGTHYDHPQVLECALKAKAAAKEAAEDDDRLEVALQLAMIFGGHVAGNGGLVDRNNVLAMIPEWAAEFIAATSARNWELYPCFDETLEAFFDWKIASEAMG